MKLDEVFEPIHSDLDRVQALLESEIAQAVERGRTGESDTFTKRAITYLLQKPGKHLRPALVLFASHATGNGLNTGNESLPNAVIQLAAAIELIHSASLIHDDIIDEAQKRRSILSVHRKYGIKIAILVGDVLFSQAFSMVAGLPDVDDGTKIKIFAALSEMTKRMCYGEIFEQDALEGDSDVSQDDYLRVIEYKTALLMSAASKCGATVMHGTDEEVRSLAGYGMHFGYAYQLVDDFRDKDGIFSKSESLKTMAADYISRTQEDLAAFRNSIYRSGMIDLAHYVLQV